MGVELGDAPIQRHPRGLLLPTSFDARDAWPYCTSLQNILGQYLASNNFFVM